MSSRMSPKERALRTIKRQEIDRLPIQMDFSGVGLDKVAKAWGLPSGGREIITALDNHIVYAYLDDAFGNIKARKLGSDEVSYDAWCVGWNNYQEGPLAVVHPLADLDGWSGYEFPDPWAPGLLERAQKTVAEFGRDYLVTSYQAYCLFERAWALRGLENFLMDLVLRRDFVETLLDKITDYQVAIAKRYVQAGVACGRTGDDYGGKTSMLFAPELWRDLIKPRLRRIWNVYKEAGVPVMHHTCGHVTPIIGDFADMGLDILNPVQPDAMDIRALKDQYGERLTFYGGISTAGALSRGTPQEVRDEVYHTVAVLGRGGGYIIAPAQGITSEVPLENIDALREASTVSAGMF
ncbi:methylcobalamin:coenzyme M methyltransferase [Peptococcaceae bacterium CEB3]|nr:methylcobalamin:coenzyme M methyltransferase [Peptococcaceae bacterium CEB3]